MHAEALEAVRRMVNVSGYITSQAHLDHSTRALDVGGADINGTARSLVPWIDDWFGLDIEPGPGVKYVADATNWPDLNVLELGGSFDVVLCTELLEHVRNWPAVLWNIWRMLTPGGYAFITCAGTDGRSWARRPHGARGELHPGPGEYYANVPLGRFSGVLDNIGVSEAETVGNHSPGDIYAWFRK